MEKIEEVQIGRCSDAINKVGIVLIGRMIHVSFFFLFFKCQVVLVYYFSIIENDAVSAFLW